MSHAEIDIKFYGGENIAFACDEATRLATLLGVNVHFMFNDVPCYARPNSDPRTLEKAWFAIVKEETRTRYAMAWSDMPTG